MQRLIVGAILVLASAQAVAFNPYAHPNGYQTWPGSWPGTGPRYAYVTYARRFVPPLAYAPHRTPTDMRRPPATPPAQPQTPPSAPVQDTPQNKATTGPVSQDTTTSQADFISRLLPLIGEENARLSRLRERVTDLFGSLQRSIPLSDAEHADITALARKYRVDGNPLTDPEARNDLLNKIDVIPASLALAQAANESAWGKSRFAREGNNLFGIWTYDESKGIVPLKRAAGKKHLVRRFDSEADSIRYYMFTLNSHPAYRELREIRARMRRLGTPLDGTALADGLTAYSAKGKEYVHLIKQLIGRFDLANFDAGNRDQA